MPEAGISRRAWIDALATTVCLLVGLLPCQQAPGEPYSFSASELYSVIAHLLELNGLIEPGRRVDAGVLTSLQMPNKDNFRSGYVVSE